MKKLTQTKRGSTLIEMMIYMGLLAMFLLILTEMYVSILNIFAQTETTSSIEQDSKYIITRLEHDISRASSINSPFLGFSQNSLDITVSSQNYTYSQSGTNLVLTNNLGANAMNSTQTEISNVSFQRLGNVGGKNTIKVQFTLEAKTEESKGIRSKTYQTTIGTR